MQAPAKKERSENTNSVGIPLFARNDGYEKETGGVTMTYSRAIQLICNQRCTTSDTGTCKQIKVLLVEISLPDSLAFEIFNHDL